MSELEGRLRAAQEYTLGEPITLTFELSNQGERDLHVLRWFTPLEGLRHDCLAVFRSGEEIFYDGPLVKRVNPVAENYLLLRAHETASVEFNLDEAYPIREIGEYIVGLNTFIGDVIPADQDPLAAKIQGYYEERSEQTRLEDDTITFLVKEGALPRQTKGEVERAKSLERPLEPSSRSPQPPAFEGGSEEERRVIVAAHTLGFQLCSDAISSLNVNSRRRKWFGADDPVRFKRIRDTFTSVLNRMVSEVFIYNLTGAGCNLGDHAYTYFRHNTVWICSLYWGQPWTGANSKPGIILHEHTHATADTRDLAYSERECRKLAMNYPNLSVLNAANYEYFAENV